jgi:hypothetical protein
MASCLIKHKDKFNFALYRDVHSPSTTKELSYGRYGLMQRFAGPSCLLKSVSVCTNRALLDRNWLRLVMARAG